MNDLQLAKSNDIDKNKVLNYIVQAPSDAAWRKIYGSAFKHCYNDVNEKFNEILTTFESPPMNIGRDQCNVKFMTLLTCIQFKVFTVTITIY